MFTTTWGYCGRFCSRAIRITLRFLGRHLATVTMIAAGTFPNPSPAQVRPSWFTTVLTGQHFRVMRARPRAAFGVLPNMMEETGQLPLAKSPRT
ncbi:hypothetical protein [Dyadobacter linearis]|uniref:hypothetical protein n=1 Tax=Dyadobacter linearis TaxID=2823330 RepID=UPI001BFBFD0E|nr:hypothetical protein [Dyadobacter sp. CECT 9623]